MKKNIIRKHNDIIEACYALHHSELRLLYSCISKITFDQSVPELPETLAISEETRFSVNAHEYSKTFNIAIGQARRDMKYAVNELWEKDITIKNGGIDGTDLTIRWLSSKTNPMKGARFKNDTVHIEFSHNVIPYLTNLKKQGNFTQYAIENLSELGSAHSIRLYEMLKKIQKISPQEISLADLKERFLLVCKYKRMKDFKDRVLDLAVNEINEKTDIHVSYENVKHGRSIVGFMFTVKKSTKASSTKRNKKFLTEAQIIAKAQKMGSLSWPQVYDKLEEQGFSFERKHKY